MKFFPRNFDTMVSNGLQRMAEHTNLTQLTPGSKTRFILDTVFEEQTDQHSTFNTNLVQAFIRFADDEFLDYFGDMLNTPRRGTTFAESTVDEQSFMFYVDSGTFGDLNSGSTFTIPAGTSITTIPFEGDIATPGLETQPIVTYTTIADIVCDSSRSLVYGGIRAAVEGKDSNIPRNVLRRHNFVSYAQSDRNLLKCTNRHAISTGEERETPNSYRYRLLNMFKAKEQAVKIAIRLAALSVPGVSNIYEVNYEQGPGTYSVYVQSTTPTTSQGLLNQVTDAVVAVTTEGVRPYVIAPTPLGIELVTAVTWSPRATAAQKSTGYAAIRDAVEATFGLYDIGESLLLADMVRTVISANQYILGIGRENPNSFERVYLTRSSADGRGVTRSLFVGDTIEPLYNERVILETGNRHRGIEFL